MRKSRFTDEQMVQTLREAGKTPVAEVAKKHGLSDQTLYVWRKRFGTMGADNSKRLKQLENENNRLKKLLAERDLEVDVLKEIAAQKHGDASMRRRWVEHARGRGLSCRRSCKLLRVARSSLSYVWRKEHLDGPIRARMRERSAQFPRYGYRRVRIFLERQGWKMSPERSWPARGHAPPRPSSGHLQPGASPEPATTTSSGRTRASGTERRSSSVESRSSEHQPSEGQPPRNQWSDESGQLTCRMSSLSVTVPALDRGGPEGGTFRGPVDGTVPPQQSKFFTRPGRGRGEKGRAMLNGVMLLWFLLTTLAVVFVAVDIRSTPESLVLKWGFILVTAYTGPIGAFLYVLGCREPLPGLHERYAAVRWRQVLGSTMHCVAGDGLGILAGAAIASYFNLSRPFHLALEYGLGFGFGWTVFQALFMRDTVGGSYRRALTKTFVPEFLSMNVLMGAMVPVASLEGLTGLRMSPATPDFWFAMSMALLAGFVAAYPMNWWLVAKGLKHGMMTVRSPASARIVDELPHGTAHPVLAPAEGEHAGHPKVSPTETFLMMALSVAIFVLGIGAAALVPGM